MKRDLTLLQVDILKRNGFHEVRDPGFSLGWGSTYLVRNATGESTKHFILWNLIYNEVAEYTTEVFYSLTKRPDVVFTLNDGRKVAVEVETTRKSEKALKPKLRILKRFDDWFFVVADRSDREHYSQFGTTLTRIEVPRKIALYFQLDSNPELKTEKPE